MTRAEVPRDETSTENLAKASLLRYDCPTPTDSWYKSE
jgi:hypothetical protein